MTVRIFFLFILNLQAALAVKPIIFSDFDSTIVTISDRNILFQKQTNGALAELEIPQSKFDDAMKLYNTPDWPWKGWEVIINENDSYNSSYRYMRSSTGGDNHLLNNFVNSAEFISNKNLKAGSFYKASLYWDEMIKALNDPVAFKNYYILTNRGNSIEHFMEFFNYLKLRHAIKFLPLEENIIALRDPYYVRMYGEDADLSLVKAQEIYKRTVGLSDDIPIVFLEDSLINLKTTSLYFDEKKSKKNLILKYAADLDDLSVRTRVLNRSYFKVQECSLPFIEKLHLQY